MKIEITGAFRTYAKAQEAVRELEFAGITGEEVEVITDAEHDGRDSKSNSSDSKFVDSKKKSWPEFSPDAGGLTKQPIPDAPQSWSVQAMPAPSFALRNCCVNIAENGSNSGDPTAKMQQDKPETTPPRAMGATASGLGRPRITTGADDTDREARGKEFRTPRK